VGIGHAIAHAHLTQAAQIATLLARVILQIGHHRTIIDPLLIMIARREGMITTEHPMIGIATIVIGTDTIGMATIAMGTTIATAAIGLPEATRGVKNDDRAETWKILVNDPCKDEVEVIAGSMKTLAVVADGRMMSGIEIGSEVVAEVAVVKENGARKRKAGEAEDEASLRLLLRTNCE
jgi:hypothetical protein